MKQLYAKEVLLQKLDVLLEKHQQRLYALDQDISLSRVHAWRVATKKLRAYVDFLGGMTGDRELFFAIARLMKKIKPLYTHTGEYRSRHLFIEDMSVFELLLQEHTPKLTRHLRKQSKKHRKKARKLLKKFLKKEGAWYKKLRKKLHLLLKRHPITNMTYQWRVYQRTIMGEVAHVVHHVDDQIDNEMMHDIRKQIKKVMYVSAWLEATPNPYMPAYKSWSDELGYVNDATDRLLYIEDYAQRHGLEMDHVCWYRDAHMYDKHQALDALRAFFQA